MSERPWYDDPCSKRGHCSECSARLEKFSNRKTCADACADARKVRRQYARRVLDLNAGRISVDRFAVLAIRARRGAR